MRTTGIVLLVVVALIFLGGSVRIGGDSVFGHLDSALGTTVLSDVYHTVFFFMQKGVESVESEYDRTQEGLKDFQDRPLGFDKKKQYKTLDDAARY